VRKLQDSQKRYLWEPSPAAGLPRPSSARRYTETPDMDNEGSGKFPMAVGDWKRAYTLLDRVQMAVVRDELTKASVGQVKFVARRRVGGKVVLANAARLLKCA
jgi:HK97 family phage major capsid protein